LLFVAVGSPGKRIGSFRFVVVGFSSLVPTAACLAGKPTKAKAWDWRLCRCQLVSYDWFPETRNWKTSRHPDCHPRFRLRVPTWPAVLSPRRGWLPGCMPREAVLPLPAFGHLGSPIQDVSRPHHEEVAGWTCAALRNGYIRLRVDEA
jgi:hypothetical protein